MPRIYKPSGPSVALREAQRGGDPGFIQAPNQIAQVDSIGRQSQAYMQSYQQQADRNNQLSSTALARAQQVQENNAQLSLQQVQNRQNLDLKASNLVGQRALSAQELALNQSAQANNVALRQSEIQNQQLTELGNSFINFSQTLWKKKADQINKENQELKVQGLVDYINGSTGTLGADIAKVNQAEILRVQGTNNAEAAALQFEQAGQKNDATMIRASNPFYLRGREEGVAMKAGLGYATYLQDKIREALDSGSLNRLDPQYSQKLSQLIGMSSGEYIKENGLTEINPAVAAKYFGYSKLQAEAQVLEVYNNEAYKAVLSAQKATAEATAYNSAPTIKGLPRDQWAGEFVKLAAVATSANRMDTIEGHKSVLNQLIRHADISNSFELVDAFVTTDRGDGNPFGSTPGIQEVYDKAKQIFGQRQAAQIAKYQDDQVAAIQADFDKAFATGDVNSIREAQDAAVSRLLQLNTPDSLAKARNIAATNPGESPLIQEQIRRAEDGGYLDRFLRENRDRMTASTYEKASKRAEQTSRLKEPAYQQALNQTLAQIRFASGEANEERQKLLPPHSRQAINDYVKLQQDKLTQYAREWLSQNPGSNPKDFQDWLKGQEKSYTDPKQFVVDPKSDLPRGMQSMGGGVEFTGNRLVARVVLGGRMREDYRNPQIVSGLVDGSVSAKAIQFNSDLVFTKDQISEAVQNYEKNGTWPNYMVQIAANTGRTVKSMVQAQARVYGGSGVIVDPGNYKLPPSPSGSGRISMDAVQDFGKSSGMSQRGSIAFATMVQDESGGDPVVPGDSGNAQGLMQWNRAASPDRVSRLQQFAQQRGKPVTDPGIQLNYAIYEMKNFYPSVWSVLTSRNPTNNQLWRATVEYLGFNPKVYAQRKESLEANLR
jgi:hypothetical protein